jgi:hypothetical protein
MKSIHDDDQRASLVEALSAICTEDLQMEVDLHPRLRKVLHDLPESNELPRDVRSRRRYHAWLVLCATERRIGAPGVVDLHNLAASFATPARQGGAKEP